MNSLLKRSITGFIFAAVVIGSALLGKWYFGTLFLVFAMLGVSEGINLYGKAGLYPPKNLIFLLSAFIYIVVYMVIVGHYPPQFLLGFLIVVPTLFIVEMYRRNDMPFQTAGAGLLLLFWIVLPLVLLNGLFDQTFARGWDHAGTLLGFFLLMWIYDSGAYLVGSRIGKHKMFERISPKKSWEGFVGGALLTLLSAMVVNRYVEEFSLPVWLCIAVCIVVFGTFGDLAESLLKRSVKAKDSGTLLPGHGGVLDRFDAVLFASPAVYIIVTFLRIIR